MVKIQLNKNFNPQEAVDDEEKQAADKMRSRIMRYDDTDDLTAADDEITNFNFKLELPAANATAGNQQEKIIKQIGKEVQDNYEKRAGHAVKYAHTLTKASIRKKLSFLAVILLLWGAFEFWEKVFPPKPMTAEEKKNYYHEIYGWQLYQTKRKKVIVANVRYQMSDVEKCGNVCIIRAKTDDGNNVFLRFRKQSYYAKLKALHEDTWKGRIDAKGIVTDGIITPYSPNGMRVLTLRGIKASDNIDIRKVLGLEDFEFLSLFD